MNNYYVSIGCSKKVKAKDEIKAKKQFTRIVNEINQCYNLDLQIDVFEEDEYDKVMKEIWNVKGESNV